MTREREQAEQQMAQMHALMCSAVDLLVEINSKLAAQGGGVSSVEVKTSTRGVDISAKAYNGSPIVPAGNAAMDEFIRVGREIEKRLMGQA